MMPARRPFRRLKAAATTLLVLGLIGAGLWFRPGFTVPIRPFDGGRSIASLEPVELGGARQWVLIRGEDRSKPILLFLHGGPGSPLMNLAHSFQRGLERDFVVVQWDRLGAGKSFTTDPAPAALSTTREMADAVELIRLLDRRFGQRRVIVVGHSYGAYLGAAVTQAHPELVRAFVAVGLPACTPDDAKAIQDSWLRQRARLTGDPAAYVAATRGGPGRDAAIWRLGGVIYGETSPRALAPRTLFAPEYALADTLNVDKGMALSMARLVRDGPALPLARGVPALAAPAFFFIGAHDYVAPSLCIERYVDRLQAPVKQEVWFDRSAHFPFLEEPARFHAELLKVAAASADRR